MSLTAVEVRNAKAGRHADGKGLYLLVKPSGSKSWVLRVQVGGRRRDYGLGSLDLVSFTEARDRALEYRKAAKSASIRPWSGRRHSSRSRRSKKPPEAITRR